ncbi:flagellar hook-associated protein FlgL [Parageobacillus thermoglucosidasius]|jgi:flagellar hook-associated protein 3 FlgL|uniref:Flagellar hook-associated protein FlgL n=1 Tax=Parageobacillus thermoglucosidasius TaxID=1426 RepID=A0AAN1D570_PARTM|nr:flagellar hook-associated protein FlgL [Parageobacillus thermoglucosidasius]ALF08761.1 flagellar biosynthesis protein FlgL [Parageobacillus thermoglucosidasius]ANZ28844.1 flagellar hook-associated protein FlgL [Parageobacillus thermoglucosidasius]APM79581.1 flagellar hook-associated protein FlgL [Parageobacillus thermoglucosidasius]KJX68420.1 flagellar hook protein FlgL [Parageobacillus thermoglucosidasius]MED4905510.1 flagellar hook-associated protein FlgL [Parageobacillus thermoglucosidas
MRVTQFMLANNMLRNLSNSYERLGKYQEQLVTGKKISRPSDDPVVAMKGIAYREDLARVKQYQRNIGEVHNWIDSADDALDKAGLALQRVQELVVQASTDTATPEDRKKIADEIEQIQKHIVDVANTKVGGKYIFNGADTKNPLFIGYPGEMGFAVNGNQSDVEIEVFDGIKLDVNIDGKTLFTGIIGMLDNLKTVLNDPNSTGNTISSHLSQVEAQQDALLAARSELGAKQNRVEMMENRLSTQEVIATKLMSNNEDIEYEKTITDLITQESVHRVALSVGARIIQPTLVDFLR